MSLTTTTTSLYSSFTRASNLNGDSSVAKGALSYGSVEDASDGSNFVDLEAQLDVSIDRSRDWQASIVAYQGESEDAFSDDDEDDEDDDECHDVDGERTGPLGKIPRDMEGGLKGGNSGSGLEWVLIFIVALILFLLGLAAFKISDQGCGFIPASNIR